MLTLELTQNEKTDLLDKKLNLLNSGTKIYLAENGEPIGVAELLFEGEVELLGFAIRPDCDSFYNRQFLFRGILFKLGQSGLSLKIKTDNKELDKYGFATIGEYKKIECKQAVYPSTCGKNC